MLTLAAWRSGQRGRGRYEEFTGPSTVMNAAQRLPTVFVSHGAPTLALQPNAAHAFFTHLGESLPRPRAIVVFSAHWETASPCVTAAQRPETIHDFYGFPRPLYDLRYPAPGDPGLAATIVERLQAAGLSAAADGARGLDHGAWIPLLLAYPDAPIPVLQVSLQPHLGTQHHLRLGQALAPLRDQGVLLLASGGTTHNLREFVGQPDEAPAADYARTFAEWVNACLMAGDLEALLDYRRKGPQAARNHPSEEHFLPLFCALGAAGGEPVQRLHHSFSHGILAMDAYGFGDCAGAAGQR